ncbi:hypothetical protein M8C13_39855 [Crossiella sp. SN42]|nr:hypothetical protein [Crossiella sp. SN42]MCO1581922.1 hypothetical protein [Crossiella sp. SN42]
MQGKTASPGESNPAPPPWCGKSELVPLHAAQRLPENLTVDEPALAAPIV